MKFDMRLLWIQHPVLNWRHFTSDTVKKANPASSNSCRLASLPKAIKVSANCLHPQEDQSLVPNKGPGCRAPLPAHVRAIAMADAAAAMVRAWTQLSSVVSCILRFEKWQILRCRCFHTPGCFGDPVEIEAGSVTLLAQPQPEPPARSFHKADLARRSLGRNRLNFGIPGENRT